MLAVQFKIVGWQVPPDKVASETRWTIRTLQPPVPVILAEHDAVPSTIFTAKVTSREFTTPSLFRSQGLYCAQTASGWNNKPAVKPAINNFRGQKQNVLFSKT